MEALPSLVCALGASFSMKDSTALSARILRCIGALGDPEACSVLHPLLRHPVAIVRAATIGALLEIGAPESDQWLKPVQEDPAVEVQRVFEGKKRVAA